MTTAIRTERPVVVSRGWWVVVVTSVLIAIYAFGYLLVRERAFPPNLAQSFGARPWGIFPHALVGGLSLVLGPLQFRRDLLLRRRALHRAIGRVWMVTAFLTGTIGLYMSAYSFGGVITHVGFGVLGALVMIATATAYLRILAGDVRAHRQWVLRAFVLIFGAVTLRFELPLLVVLFRGDFTPAYRIVAWLAWVPNLIWAEWWIRRTQARTVPVHSTRAPGDARAEAVTS